jgi:LPS export ABC transporter protein LptC
MLGCQSENNIPQQKLAIEQLQQLPTHTSWNFSMVIMDSNRVKSTLKARLARVYDQRQETRLDTSVVVEFMNSNSQRVGILTADSAVVDDKTRNMFAYGNVKVVSDSTHTTLKTAVLMWNNKTQKLYTTEKFSIRSPTEVIDGIGMESDQYLKNYKMFKVSGIKKL